MENDVLIKLKNCDTVKEMLELLLSEYDLNVEPGIMTRTLFINGLKSGITTLKPKRKNVSA